MTFRSYAQNCEDVMLLRALHKVERGFYIDVGAQDPVDDSVTKAFYERGWRGINIDPVEHWYRRLLKDRPRDINLQLAASDARGSLHFHEVADTGLSTCDPAFAAQHKTAGREVFDYEVECKTLDEICAEHSVGTVHFLKIDVEGAEAAVLRGLSLERIRPWIILVEAMLPNSQKPAWQDWQPLLDPHGYVCVYEDGLNRFYLSPEHTDLKEAFRFPPNVLDDFVQHRTAAAMEYLQAENERREAALLNLRQGLERSLGAQRELERGQRVLEQEKATLHIENERREFALGELRALLVDERRTRDAEYARLQSEIDRLGGELDTRQRNHDAEHARLQEEIDRMHGEMVALDSALSRQHDEILARDQIIVRSTEAIQALRASTSWRVTAPLRWSVRIAKSAQSATADGAIILLRPVAHGARPAVRRLARIAWLRQLAVKLLKADSRIANRARWFVFGPPVPQSQSELAGNGQMTRSALRVLGQLHKLQHSTSGQQNTRKNDASGA